MNGNREAAEGWLRKAESDLANAELCLNNNTSLDAACFHCQQAAEKALKAWLIAHDQPFPFRHDLTELISLCAARQPRFNEFLDEASALTPFATGLRYDADFWPAADKVRTALQQARRVYDFVRQNWS
jgi:HEPN domain-containing protein